MYQSQERKHHRLEYPEGGRAKAKLNNQSYEICEISEGGMRVLWAGPQPATGKTVVGIIEFRDGNKLEFKGEYSRIDGPFVIIVLDEGIPKDVLLQEQLHMLSPSP